MNLSLIEAVDPEIAEAISAEMTRQSNTLEMIASENIVSPAVMAAQGCIMTNKYAEGYPDKRYYGGCEFVDVAEKLAIERAKALFGAEYANVQPHSGSQANMAVYFALLNNGDTVLGMDLAHGGHLTHGSPVSFSGRFFKFVHYGVKQETGVIDYDDVARLAREHRPRMIVAGASAYPRIIDFKAFSEIAESAGAYLMVDMAHIAGLVAAGFHPSPVPYAHVVTSTTHKTLRGPRGGLILARSDIGGKINSNIFPGIQGGPLMHVIAAKAVAFHEAQTVEFRNYQRQIIENAKTLAECLTQNGIELVSGGTDNHMMLLDLRNLGLTGRQAETLLEAAGITVNKNAIPFDPQKPTVTSGVRIGTPTVTSRGMGVVEMKAVGEYIVKVLKHHSDNGVVPFVRNRVDELCREFPIFPAGEARAE